MRKRQKQICTTKPGFTLVEVLIIVSVLGILAALAFPIFTGHIQQAKESAAKDSLRILRNTIELYAAQHNGVAPGYWNDDPSAMAGNIYLMNQVLNGEYLPEYPTNPFSEKQIPKLYQNSEEFPTQASDYAYYGWLYKPATKTIKLNWVGTDSKGVDYFDY